MPTSGREWRKPIEIELPSGKVAELRPVDFSHLVTMIDLPDWLLPMVQEMFTADFPEEQPKTPGKVEVAIDDMKKLHGLYAAIARIAFVSPRIVDDPQSDDEISIADVEWGDLVFVYGLLGKPQIELQRFSAIQRESRNLELVRPESGDTARAESDTEDRPMGSPSHRRKRVS